MSRFSKKLDNETFIYGHDHALGYFYEIWKPENEDSPVVEKSTLFEKLTQKEFISQLEKFNASGLHILKAKLHLPL
jgi:hypothetical protein